MTDRVAMLRGATVYRIHWRLGTDLLVGVCHCGAERDFEDPIVLWDWLLAHPHGHDQRGDGPSHTEPLPAERQPVGVGAP